jgi:hypothetical protein
MPTPRSHGGAAISLIPMTLPGFKGLNRQMATGILGPEWATRLENAVIDDNSRVAARKGWNNVTSSALPVRATGVHFFWNGTTDIMFTCSGNRIDFSTNGGATFTLGSPTWSPGPNIQFANFNGKVYAAEQGSALAEGTGGVMAQQAVANVPSGNCILGAYGRLWASLSNKTSFRCSGLLDGDDWSSADSYLFDMSSIWLGTDEITALAAFNGALVVFGRKNIVFFVDGAGSALGVDPTQMYVADIINGTGCIARDSVQLVDGDLWFLSQNGLQSLGRVIQEKSNPLDNLSKNVQDALRDSLVGYNLDNLRSVYSPLDRIYLLSLPGASGGGEAIAFDTRGKLEDGSARCMGVWSQPPTGMAISRAGVWYYTIYSQLGKVGTYSAQYDATATYNFVYESGWLDLTQQGLLLFPKRIEGVFFADNDISVNFKWAFDFKSDFRTQARNFTVAGASLYGTAVWGTSLWGGGVSLRRGKVSGGGSGEYIKVGISTTIDGAKFAVQQLDLFAKVGRYA